jgi:hypothetical protein
VGIEWFRRLADIPEVDYEPPVTIERRSLPGHDFEPRVGTVGEDEKESLWWPPIDRSVEQTTSAVVTQHLAPALTGDGVSGEALIRRLWEALELPGRPRDYHVALQNTAIQLSGRRHRAEPGAVRAAEQIALLDCRLVEMKPSCAERDDEDGGVSYVWSVGMLCDLYMREGFLAEALAFARKARPGADGTATHVRGLEARLEALRVEDGR